MCLQNDNTREKLVNGSRGVITGFKTWVETFVLLKHELHVAPDGIGGLIELKIRWLHEIFEGNNVPDYKCTTFLQITQIIMKIINQMLMVRAMKWILMMLFHNG